MADLYTSSMFGGEFPYWQEKYGNLSLGYDFEQGKEQQSYLNSEEENRVLSAALNYFGVTPDMGVRDLMSIYGDIEDKYKKKTSWLGKKEWDVPALNNVMRNIWAQSGLDQSRKLGWEDTAAMMRKYLLTKGLLSTRGPKDDPKVDVKTDAFDLPYSLEPVHAKIGKGSWNEFYDLGLEKLGGRFDYKPKDEIEFKPYGADKDEVVEIIEYQGG